MKAVFSKINLNISPTPCSDEALVSFSITKVCLNSASLLNKGSVLNDENERQFCPRASLSTMPRTDTCCSSSTPPCHEQIHVAAGVHLHAMSRYMLQQQYTSMPRTDTCCSRSTPPCHEQIHVPAAVHLHAMNRYMLQQQYTSMHP